MDHRTRIGALVALTIASCVSSRADAQDLATALAARYPTRELVPQSCTTREGDTIVLAAGRICLRDRATGLVRAVRRIALSSDWIDTSAVARDGEVLFAVTDQGGAATRFAGRVWRWDLTRDAYLGLAQTDTARIVDTAFGVLYRTQAGWRRVGEESATRVDAPEDLLDYGVSTFTHEGATYVVMSLQRVEVETLALEGRSVQLRDHASLPGTLLYADRGVVVSAVQARGGVIQVHLLRLPATEPTIIVYPPGMRRPTSASLEGVGTLLLSGPRGERASLDLAQGTITRVEASAPATPPELLRASSLYSATPTARGVYLSASSSGYLLDASGVSTPRTAPRAARSRCRCVEADLVCRGAESTPIVGACAEVAELDRIRADYAETTDRSTQITGDGAFRIDRLEADLVRVTRLRDGARLWTRIVDGALFAQLDDGTYFLSNRDLASRFAVREGALTTGAVTPLAPRAAQLFRETLIAEFFAP
ncbi:hypothetical protein [Sandaracinus amylolyticus]|uniref:hypothetical protein n=1 Tax=Sandaracinus amylolyticus TaxID=927083 RepID=UPI001F46BD94|nr:hypothetical protein [Sandaracinus amylolyticus]UJR84973.1 Hypothetical protein I5071_70520 [Sandaracinus amylolyticus]